MPPVVAETTKFNEIYLLKGDNASTKNVYMKGHDAGLKGTLTDSAKSAIYVMDTLKEGDKNKIAGKEYTIGIDKAEIIAAIDQYKAADKQITVDGNSYTYKAATTGGTVIPEGWYKDGNQVAGGAVTIANIVKDGSKATVGTKEYAAMNDANGDGVDDDDSSIISAKTAKGKLRQNFRLLIKLELLTEMQLFLMEQMQVERQPIQSQKDMQQ